MHHATTCLVSMAAQLFLNPFCFSTCVSTFTELNYSANICNKFIKPSKYEELFSN